MAPGCAKWRKANGHFCPEEFDVFYSNAQNKSKISKPKETSEASHEEKWLPPMLYLPGPFGQEVARSGMTVNGLKKMVDRVVTERAACKADVAMLMDWCLAAGQVKYTALPARSVNESKLAMDHITVDNASPEFRRLGMCDCRCCLGQRRGRRGGSCSQASNRSGSGNAAGWRPQCRSSPREGGTLLRKCATRRAWR